MRRVAERHGPQAVAFTVSSPSTTTIGDSTGFIQRLANGFGTPNANITLDICGWAVTANSQRTRGLGFPARKKSVSRLSARRSFEEEPAGERWTDDDFIVGKSGRPNHW